MIFMEFEATHGGDVMRGTLRDGTTTFSAEYDDTGVIYWEAYDAETDAERSGVLPAPGWNEMGAVARAELVGGAVC